MAVEEILQRLGAKQEQGSTAEELDDYTNHFNGTDPNRDGKHTKEEYVDNGHYMTPQARAAIFRAADGNADGVVTRDEYVLNRVITDEAKTIVGGMDDNKDGSVERAEFVQHATKLLSDPKLAEQVYAAFDANADGAITIPEYLRVWGQWARIGRKSAEELIQARRAELADLKDHMNDSSVVQAGRIVKDEENPTPISGFEAMVFRGTANGQLPFRMREPEPFKVDETTKYPLLVFLHGNGSRGNDNQKQLTNAPGHLPEGDNTFLTKYPCFIVAPQSETNWNAFIRQDESLKDVPQRESGRLVVELIETLVGSGRVDPNRIYITGLSLGSWGASHILWRRPDLFASALLCTGGMDARTPKSLKNVKIWWFMGTEDREELVIPAKKRVEACKKLGADITYTEIEGGDHASSWLAAYGDPQVWDWVFAQKKGKWEGGMNP